MTPATELCIKNNLFNVVWDEATLLKRYKQGRFLFNSSGQLMPIIKKIKQEHSYLPDPTPDPTLPQRDPPPAQVQGGGGEKKIYSPLMRQTLCRQVERRHRRRQVERRHRQVEVRDKG